jgi:ribosome-binding ATPase YchF (GTP1/OBG family)
MVPFTVCKHPFMRIGLVGYKGSGKSSLFQWLTGIVPDPALSHSLQSAIASIPEPRFTQLTEIYHPKKITYAGIEIVDTPGLARDQQGNPARLAQLREADALVWVVPTFDGNDPVKEIADFGEDTVIADLEIVLNRIEKVIEQNKRPVPKTQHELYEFELETLEVLREGLEQGKPVAEGAMTPEQQRVVRGFRLLSSKPRMIIINTPDDTTDLQAAVKSCGKQSVPVVPVSAALELELEKMSGEEKKSFLAEMQLTSTDKGFVLKTILDASGQMTFLTAGEKELRTWLVAKGGSALDAAAAIHTDMAKGFIRAEVMRAEDLIRLGSERAVKAENLVRREPKDYIVQDGDIFLFHFS